MSSFKKAFSLIELSIVILIIGILVAGVTQGSRLVREMKFETARSMTKASDVNSIADLAIWLETTSDKSFTVEQPEDGVAIAQWNDINPQVTEGRKFPAINATGGTQPLYTVGALNGLPALRFDGINDNMAVADGFDNDTENVTVFFVWKPNSTGTAEMDLLEKWEGSSVYPYVLRSTTIYSLRAYDLTLSPTVSSTTRRLKDNIVILSARRTKSGILSLWVNGVKEGADVVDTTSATVGSTVNNGRLGICARLTSNVGYCNGDVGEAIIFSRALKDEERKAVEKYLGKKWRIRVT